MSPLERLPPAIRRKIYQYLLVSDYVRQPPNDLLIEHYDFQVNVLRLNKAIHKEATAIFHQQNMFVKVHNYFKQAEESMLNHEIPFFKLKRDFKQHITEITIKYDPVNKRMASNVSSKSTTTFLLLLADIPKYTRLLRLLDLANFLGYQFEFKLHQPPSASAPLSKKKQLKLLSPFKQVRGAALIQKVTFLGAFDPVIVKRVTIVMTHKIAWLRAGAWEIHSIALSIKQMADLAFRLNNADKALAKYDDARKFMDTALKTNSMMEHLDRKFHLAICELETTIWVDTALLMLSDAMVKETGERQFKTVPNMLVRIEAAEKLATVNQPVLPTTVVARFYQLLGIAELGLNHPVKAAKAFVKAFKLVPDQNYEQGYQVAKTWKEANTNTRSLRLKKLFTHMPREPLSVSGLTEYATPEVESEHWVMRKLGYEGPFQYEDKIKGAVAVVLTNKPHPDHHNRGPRTAQIGFVKPEVLQKHVENYSKFLHQPPANGRFTCWVGLKEDQIGETTIYDQPEWLEATRNMANQPEIVAAIRNMML